MVLASAVGMCSGLRSTDQPADGSADGNPGSDASANADADAGRDGTSDVGIGAAVDAGTEGGLDGGESVDADASGESSVDASLDAIVRADADAGSDATTEADADAGRDATADVGIDATVDAGTEGGSDGGESGDSDASVDARAEADVAAGLDASDSGDGGCPSACSGSTPACLNGSCVACAPRATQCLGNSVKTCDNTGHWGTPVPCDGATPYCSAGVCGQPPSCQVNVNGTANCGPGGSGNESCCSSLEVDGGMYNRTYTNTGSGPTGAANPATVSSFRLDKYLVTVGRFRQYVNYVTGTAGAPPANGSGIHTHLNGGLGLANSGNPGTYETGWDATDWNQYIATGPSAASTWNASLTTSVCTPYDTWTNVVGSQENLPINCVNWYEAYAFCIWDGGFLPSEAEWEYAAAGGSEELQYPWGSTDPGTGNQYAIYDCYYPDGTGSCSRVRNIAPAGTATLGGDRWGQLDMVGDESEWNLDWYSTYVDPCMDCAYLSSASYRVFRGGSFYDDFSATLGPPFRDFDVPFSRSRFVGFRCARAP